MNALSANLCLVVGVCVCASLPSHRPSAPGVVVLLCLPLPPLSTGALCNVEECR